MGKKIMKCFYLAVLISVVFIVVAIFTSTSEKILINNEAVTNYNDGWHYSINGEERGELGSLPQKVNDVGKNDRVLIKNSLPETYVQGMTICFRSVQQFVRVFVDGQQVYEYGYESSRLFGKSPGSAWNFVRMPNNTAGKEISIELMSPYDGYNDSINKIQYGSKNANVFSIISDNIVGLFISIILIIIGLVLLATFFFLRKHGKSNAVLYLGIFAVFAGVWSSMETRMLQFAFSNQGNIVLFAFLALMLMGIPLLLFIAETHSFHDKRPFYLMCYLLLINFVVSVLLQVFGIVDFIEFPIVTHVILVASISLVVISVLVEVIKFKNKDIYILGIGSCVLVAISLLDIPQFYHKTSGDNSFFFRFGVLFYILILSFYTVKKFLGIVAQNMQTKALAQLAYLDLLTNLLNRTAFETNLEAYRSGEADCDGLIFAIFDVNNLKLTNDAYGHKSGDDLIIRAGRCLKEAFGSNAYVYRTGGDEFAVVSKTIEKVEFITMLDKFDEEVNCANFGSYIQLSVAYGFAQYDGSVDKDVDALYVRADGYMYEKKAKMKGSVGRRRSDKEAASKI